MKNNSGRGHCPLLRLLPNGRGTPLPYGEGDISSTYIYPIPIGHTVFSVLAAPLFLRLTWPPKPKFRLRLWMVMMMMIKIIITRMRGKKPSLKAARSLN